MFKFKICLIVLSLSFCKILSERVRVDGNKEDNPKTVDTGPLQSIVKRRVPLDVVYGNQPRRNDLIPKGRRIHKAIGQSDVGQVNDVDAPHNTQLGGEVTLAPYGEDGRRKPQGLRIKEPAPIKQITPKPSMLRIKAGFMSDTRNFPYMAAIIIHGRFWCAGSLVDVNWVLTAAHCLNYVLLASPMKTLGKYVKVRMGSAQAYSGGTVANAVGAIRHPKFEEEPVPHADIALLKLNFNIAPNERMNIIEIYEGFKEPYTASFITAAGWGGSQGKNEDWVAKTPDLMTARLKVRSLDYCYDAYEQVHGFMFTPDFFCASLRNGTRDVCLFDAGAPAVQHNKLLGVMSFGPDHCGNKYQPSVFIKAFYFKDFVKHTIKNYKTDAELIAAMKVVNPSISKEALIVKPPVEPDLTVERSVEAGDVAAVQVNLDKIDRMAEGYDA